MLESLFSGLQENQEYGKPEKPFVVPPWIPEELSMSIKPGAILCFFMGIVFVVPFLVSLGWSATAIMVALLILAAGSYVASREVNALRLHFAQLREAAIQLDPSLATRPDGSVPISFIPLLLLAAMLAINAFIALVVGPLWWVMCLFTNMVLGSCGVAFAFSRLQGLQVKDRLKLLYLQFCCAGAAFGGLPLLLQLEGAPSWLISSLVAFCYAFVASMILLRCLIWLNLPWIWRFIRMLYIVSCMHRDASTSLRPQEPPTVKTADGLAPGTSVALSVALHIVAPAQSLKQDPEMSFPVYQQGYQPTTAFQPLAEEVSAYSSQEAGQEAYERPQAAYPDMQRPQT
jgi:hypothetical protein